MPSDGHPDSQSFANRIKNKRNKTNRPKNKQIKKRKDQKTNRSKSEQIKKRTDQKANDLSIAKAGIKNDVKL